MSYSSWSTRAKNPSKLAQQGGTGPHPSIAGRPFFYGSGVLHEEFVQRLDLLRRATGLTRNGFADVLGVDRKQFLRWNEGTEPCGGAMLSIVRLAGAVPGGLDLILGDGFRPPWGGHRSMPRQKMRHQRGRYEFPEDFAGCLRRFKEASGLSWSELARRLGTSPLTIRRWMNGVQPSAHYLLALQDLAEELSLAHLLPRARALHRQ